MRHLALLLAGLGVVIGQIDSRRGEPRIGTVEALSDAIGQFSHEILVQVAENNTQSNIVFSPLSLHSVVTLLTLGATHQTKEELLDVLGSFINPIGLVSGYNKVLGQYDGSNLVYGNRIWVNNQFDVNPNYTKDIESLRAGVERLNFSEEGSVGFINRWVSSLTNGKIAKLLDNLAPNAQMLLCNAIYFKENWDVAFKEEKRKRVFRIQGDPEGKGEKEVNMTMMVVSTDFIQHGTFRFDDLSEFEDTVIRVPYLNSDLVFQIILPNEKWGTDGLNVLMNKLKTQSSRGEVHKSKYFTTIEDRTTWSEREIELSMPRFSAKAKINAKQVLYNLGAKSVFTEQSSLGRLSTNAELLRVDRVVHKAVINVDLEGTEGAAASFVEIHPLSFDTERPLEVVVDRPFLYMVYDSVNRIPILLGKMVDPTQ